MTTPDLTDHTDLMNAHLDGYNAVMGLRFTRATTEEVTADLVVGPQHLQPYGLVHGGVYAGMIETLCSVGAALTVMPTGKTTVGLENTTSFLRAARGGTLTARATPIARGRRSQVWEAEVRDEKGRLVATGRVRLMNLDPGAEAGGEVVAPRGAGA